MDTLFAARKKDFLQKKHADEKGFTLVELMVVVAIIAILAAIGIPKMAMYIKVAESAEPVEQMGKMSKAIRGYIDSHPGAANTDLQTALNGKILSIGADNTLKTKIPTLSIADNAKFAYKIHNITIDATTKAAKFCIKAVAGSTYVASAAAVYFTETAPTDKTIWEGQIYRAGYADGGSTILVPDGDCPADAAGTAY